MLFALASFALAGIPQGSVGLEVEAYGEHLAGALVLDTTTLDASGARLVREGEVLQGQVELRTGMRVVRGDDRHRLDGGPEVLMAFDDNGDGYVDASDRAFGGLALFVDRDGDGQVGDDELVSLASLGVAWISRYGQVAFEER